MLKISTAKFQDMISKAIKGVGNNKLIPRTTVIAIKVVNNVLTLMTSDDDNFLNVSEEVESEDFYVAVQAEQFSKLVMRTTSEYISLDLVGDVLEVHGNGAHKFPVEIDVNTGTVVDYPDPVSELMAVQQQSIGKIDIHTVQTILGAVKPSIAISDEQPQYTNYYLGDVILATDTFKISCLTKKVTAGPILVSARLMDLLEVYKGATPMSIFKVANRLIFVGTNCTICGYAADGIDVFPVDKIMEYISDEYSNKCTLPKQPLLQLIDRLSLFVGAFDDGVVNIEFAEDGLHVSSQKSDSVEVIPYEESDIKEPTSGKVYLEMFKAQVKAQTTENVELYFGDGKSLKLVDFEIDVTSVVSLVV